MKINLSGYVRLVHKLNLRCSVSLYRLHFGETLKEHVRWGSGEMSERELPDRFATVRSLAFLADLIVSFSTSLSSWRFWNSKFFQRTSTNVSHLCKQILLFLHSQSLNLDSDLSKQCRLISHRVVSLLTVWLCAFLMLKGLKFLSEKVSSENFSQNRIWSCRQKLEARKGHPLLKVIHLSALSKLIIPLSYYWATRKCKSIVEVVRIRISGWLFFERGTAVGALLTVASLEASQRLIS